MFKLYAFTKTNRWTIKNISWVTIIHLQSSKINYTSLHGTFQNVHNERWNGFYSFLMISVSEAFQLFINNLVFKTQAVEGANSLCSEKESDRFCLQRLTDKFHFSQYIFWFICNGSISITVDSRLTFDSNTVLTVVIFSTIVLAIFDCNADSECVQKLKCFINFKNTLIF